MERLAYSVDEAAEALGLSRDTLYDLMRDGELRSVKAGARRIIPADALANYLGSGA